MALTSGMALPISDRDRPGDTFRGWLHGITRNKLLDYFRRRNHGTEAQGGTDANRQLQQVRRGREN